MSTSRINDWLQVVGLFGVIGSLVFVGLQMKQTQEVALSAIYQARAASSVEHNASNASNPTYVSGIAKLFANASSSLTTEEKVVLEFAAGNEMTLHENNHFQYQQGFLSEEHWQKSLAEMQCFFEHPFNRHLLDAWSYRSSFRKVMDEAREQGVNNPKGCWDTLSGLPTPE